MKKRFMLLSMLGCVAGVSAEVAVPAVQDTYIQAPDGDTNYGTNHTFWVRAANPSSNWGRMGYLGFDLSTVTDISTMVNATLEMQVESISHTGSIDFNVYGITNAWDESTLTWNNAPSKYNNSDGSVLSGGATLLASIGSGSPASLGFVAGQPFTISSPELLAFLKENEGGTVTLILAPKRNTSSGGGIWFDAREFNGGANAATLRLEEPGGKMLTSVQVTGPVQINEETAGYEYTCMAFFDDGSSNNVTDAAVWSDDSDYATITAGILAAGAVDSSQAVTVSASYTYGVDTHSNSLSVTLMDVPVPDAPVVTNVIFSEDFETTLSNFTWIVNAADPANSNAYSAVAGVNHDTGAEEGTAAHIGDNLEADGTAAAGWIQANDLLIDPASNFTVSIDFKFEHEAPYDDSLFFIGDLDGKTYYRIGMSESAEAQKMWLVENGDLQGTETKTYSQTLSDDTWYAATIGWDAATEILTLHVDEVAGVSDVLVFSVALDGSEDNKRSLSDLPGRGLQFGFGTYNDRASCDNVVIKGTVVPAIPETPLFAEDFENGGISDFSWIMNVATSVNENALSATTGVNRATGVAEGTAMHIGDNLQQSDDNHHAAGWAQLDGITVDPEYDFMLVVDVKFEHEANYDDANFFVGNLDEKSFYRIGIGENPESRIMWAVTNGVKYGLVSTTNGVVETLPPTVEYAGSFVDDTWYTATIEWDAGAQSMSFNAVRIDGEGGGSFPAVPLDGSSTNNPSLMSMTTNGVQFGFGTYNDQASFDNIVIYSWIEADAPHVRVLSVTPTQMTVSFDSVPQVGYELQWRADMALSSWSGLEEITATDYETQHTFDLPDTGADKGFFRIVVK